MTEKLQQLVDALRKELQEYGGVLALLDQQQELIKSHTVPQLAEVVEAIDHQMQDVRQARESRISCQSELAGLLQMDQQNDTLVELSRFVPDEYRLQITALVEENNRLLRRVRQRVRQNHLMLSRSVELIQRVLDSLLSTARTSVYDDSGQLAKQPVGRRSLWNTVA